jgi:hypothetical protein
VRLRFRFGQDLDRAAAFHRREPLQPQRRQEDVVRRGDWNGLRGDDVHRSLHARVEQEVAVHHLADRGGDRLDVRIHEVERDAFFFSGDRGAGQRQPENENAEQFVVPANAGTYVSKKKKNGPPPSRGRRF